MRFHLIGTLESITSPHKHKAQTLDHISIPLIILNIKSAVETATVPWTDWQSVSVALPANNMLSKSVQLTSNMVDNTQSGACPYKDMNIGRGVQQPPQTSEGPALVAY